MNILFCGDSYIENGVLIAVLSLLKQTDQKINVYILTASLETEQKNYVAVSKQFKEFLEGVLKEKNSRSRAFVIDITEIFKNQLPVNNMDTRFTPMCMLRLFADLVDELPDKILYLDNDVIIRKDINGLYSTDISDFEICGVLDYYGSLFFKKHVLKRDYLNSGVLLLNMSKIRKSGLFSRCRAMCDAKKMFMPDQSALNKLAVKKTVARKFNEQRKLKDDTVIQHFTTSFRFFPIFKMVSVKPWQVEKMHSELKLFEYDDILNEFLRYRENYYEYKKGNTNFLFG
ncbi:MAG: hypothetical protein IJO86_03900 [Oscillospiraceae bacterium]|nr:hypothetical protein [Oscillospiraceae bacterium]